MIQQLSQQEFKNKVFDFEKHQDWQYIGDKPCIIDFYADWCQPCKIVAPVLERIAENFADQIHIYKIDVDQDGEIAGLFGINSIPSLLFVSMNNLPRMEVGALPLPSILQIMEEELGIAVSDANQ